MVGVDISVKAIEVACRAAENAGVDITFQVEDLEALPFKDNTFDIVFCGGVLHHFPNIGKVATELYRVLKKDGKLYAYEANRSNPITFLFFTSAKISRRILPLGYFKRKFSLNERALSIKDLKGTLENIGFCDFYFDSINIRSIGDNSSKFSNKIRNLIFSLSEKYLPSLSKGIHIVISCTTHAK